MNKFKKIALTAMSVLVMSTGIVGCANTTQNTNSSDKGQSEFYKRSLQKDVDDANDTAKSFWNEAENKTNEAKDKATDFIEKKDKKGWFNKAKDKVNQAKDDLVKTIDENTSNDTQAQGDVELANLESNGQKFVTVNDNKSALTWNWTVNKIDYSNLDSLNRAGKATAYLDKNNYGKSAGRESQTWKPTGWNNQKRNQDRGHLIAYTLSFNFDQDGNYVPGEKGSIDNPKNLFTQTSESNRGIMQDYETQVREAIKNGHKVIYEVTPIFRGDELMARGVHVQAISEDKSLDFNAYLFNVSDDYTFDYATGRSTKN